MIMVIFSLRENLKNIKLEQSLYSDSKKMLEYTICD